ncbi:MAG: hypothetical protein JKY65_19820 [Planctomycetes bacterium]|nr:hypothetical protein [Planctomycetota bacterium]
MKPLLILTLIFASTSLATAGTYEEWFRTVGAARLGEYSPAFKKPESFDEAALLETLKRRLGANAAIDKAQVTKWWGKVGDRKISVWGDSFRITAGGFWVVVRRFELPTPADALALGLHVQHEASAVVQVRGKRLIVTESYYRLDMSRNANRAEAVMTSLWDTWKGTPKDGLRATLLVSGQDGNAHFAGEINVPAGDADLEDQARDFLAKAVKHPNTRAVILENSTGGLAFRYATQSSLGRLAVAISAQTAPSKGMSDAIRRR